ncbi:hypothetical protein BD560DRAFT_385908 [Blakeslea trispora]|nr:hypothetical protein BD560DRAFT_385908 [Blakeslea trispora]
MCLHTLSYIYSYTVSIAAINNHVPIPMLTHTYLDKCTHTKSCVWYLMNQIMTIDIVLSIKE